MIDPNPEPWHCAATMLTASELELVTTAVDQALSPAQTRAFRALLVTKPTAADLFRSLSADALRLRAVGSGSIPVSQVNAVLNRIEQRATPRTVRSSRPLIFQYAVAASIFFTLCSASFLIFTARNVCDVDKAQNTHLPIVDITSPSPERDSVVIAPSTPKATPENPVSPFVGPETPPRDVLVQKILSAELAPAPRPAIGDVVGSGIIVNPKPLTEVRLRLPYLVEASELGSPEAQDRLKTELTGETPVRVDLFSRNPTAAFELIATSTKSAGFPLTVDAKTQDGLNKKATLSVAFYFDGLTLQESLSLFGAIAKANQTAAKPEPVGAAHIVPVGPSDFRDMKELLGIDWTPVRSPRTGEPKSVSNDTLGQVTNAVKKIGEKSAIATAYLPANLRTGAAQSKEIQVFLAKRGDRKPGTSPLLIVLR